ncbi:MAG: hypothetical protein K6B15_03535 [Parasporobacterium sp.]|nr:hypothetical protein [Parasporobacterium sp.]
MKKRDVIAIVLAVLSTACLIADLVYTLCFAEKAQNIPGVVLHTVSFVLLILVVIIRIKGKNRAGSK